MKHLLIVADDFGYGVARNKGMIKCFQENAVSTLSLLPNCKHSKEAVISAKAHKIPLGLHFNLTEGYPMSAPHKVESLLGADGKFLGKSRFWAKNDINPYHVRNELLTQVSWFQSQLGYTPMRVDGHQHVHVHKAVVKTFSQVLANNKVHTTRLPIEHSFSQPSYETSPEREVFHSLVESCSNTAKEEFAKHSISHTEAFLGLNFMGSAMTVERLQSTIKSVFASGVSTCELMCHPGNVCNPSKDGFIGEDSADSFSCSPDREHEMNILASNVMQNFFQEENISLCVSTSF